MEETIFEKSDESKNDPSYCVVCTGPANHWRVAMGLSGHWKTGDTMATNEDYVSCPQVIFLMIKISRDSF